MDIERLFMWWTTAIKARIQESIIRSEASSGKGKGLRQFLSPLRLASSLLGLIRSTQQHRASLLYYSISDKCPFLPCAHYSLGCLRALADLNITRAHVLVSTTGTSFPFTLPHTNYASSTSRLAFSFWRGTNITTDFCTYHGHQKSYDPFCAVFCFRAPIFSSTQTSIIISIVLGLIRSRMDLRT